MSRSTDNGSATTTLSGLSISGKDVFSVKRAEGETHNPVGTEARFAVSEFHKVLVVSGGHLNQIELPYNTAKERERVENLERNRGRVSTRSSNDS